MDGVITFGQWVKQRRKALGLRQDDLARLDACSKETINKIEGGQRRPSLQIAKLLALHLKIDAADYKAFLRLARPDLALGQLDLTPLSQSAKSLRKTPLNWPAPLLPASPTPLI